MGVLPLEFAEGVSAESLGLDGTELFEIENVDLAGGKACGQSVRVVAHAKDGDIEFVCKCRVDTPTETAFVSSGGILPFVLDSLANKG